MEKRKIKFKDGYAALTTTLLTVIVSLIIIAGFSFFAFQEVKVNRTYTKSIESYYVAEGGIEDALYRVVTGKQITSGETLGVGKGTTTIFLTTSGNQRIVRSEGMREKFQQNVELLIDNSISGVNFNYGAQIGDDGLEMENNSSVVGSVYSNGDIVGDTGVTITGDVLVAGGTPAALNQSWTVQNSDVSVGTSTGSIIYVVDSGTDVGRYNSLGLGSDGFARISYYDNTNDDLKFARCTDAVCAPGSVNVTTVDSTGNVGQYTSLAIGSDGFARISYYRADGSNEALKFVRCTNDDCTTHSTPEVIDTSGSNVGQYTSLAIGSDGFARISYYANGDLRFVRCTNADCTTHTSSATADSTNDTGKNTSLVLGSEGFARISYRNETQKSVKFAHCTNEDCSSGTVTNVIEDTSANLGEFRTSLALDSNGFARISYYNSTNGDLRFARCSDADCASVVLTTTVDSGGSNDVGKRSSLKLASDGFARISYYDASAGDLKFAKCNDADCVSPTPTITAPDPNNVGDHTSLQLGSDGFGRITYYDISTDPDRLKFIRCLEDPCRPQNAQVDVGQSFQPTITDRITQIDLYLKKVGNPADATLRLIRNSGGSPSTNPSDVIATGLIPASSVGTGYGWFSVVLSSTPTLSANTTYWIMIDAMFDNANYFVWGGDSAAGYTRGSPQKTGDWTIGGWTNMSGDLDFRAYMGGTDHRITDVVINGDAQANIIDNSTVGGDVSGVTFSNGLVSGNISVNALSNCTVGGNAAYNTVTSCTIVGSQTTPNTPPAGLPPLAFPISDSMITGWKDDATAGGVCAPPDCLANGNFDPTSCSVSLGPKKITGTMTLDSNCPGGQELIVTGTVWVVGDIDISNNARIVLSPGYGDMSGVVLTDGTIHLSNNSQFAGSGTPGSYLMLLSTVIGGGHHGSAIDLHNNATGAIFYAQNGMIFLHNNVTVSELVGKKVHLENNATLIYEIGLENVRFSAGPSGGYDVKYWKKVE